MTPESIGIMLDDDFPLKGLYGSDAKFTFRPRAKICDFSKAQILDEDAERLKVEQKLGKLLPLNDTQHMDNFF